MSSKFIPNNRNRGRGSRGRANRRRPRRNRANAGNVSESLAPPQPRGDVPRAPRRTWDTQSCRVPRETSSYTFRQIYENGYLTASNTATVTAQYNFQFGNLDNVASLGALFDQYRFDAVTIHVVPTQNALQVADPTATNYQPLYIVVDYDDNVALGSQSAARQYDSCIELSPGESCKRTICPRVDVASVISGTPTSAVTLSAPWVDVAVTTLPHYGFKVLIPQAHASQTLLQQWNVFFEYHVTMRSVR